MNVEKVVYENKKQQSTVKKRNTNFLYTVLFSFFGCLGLAVYIFFNIPPKNIQWIILFISLLSYCVTIIFALVFYTFSKGGRTEYPKDVFRRQLNKGAVFGTLFFIFFMIQIYFDIL